MRSSDIKREENYCEFLRLSQDDNYVDVTYDENSGGVSAIHKLHKFDKQQGVCGMRRGDYERVVVNILRKTGYRIILESEAYPSVGVKVCDGLLDDMAMEIKTIEGNGTWSVSTKLRAAVEQHASCVVLYFPEDEHYSPQRIVDGIRLAESSPNGRLTNLTRLLIVVGEHLITDWDKKATPIEGWSIREGLRRQNGADPFTISPSDTKV